MIEERRQKTTGHYVFNTGSQPPDSRRMYTQVFRIRGTPSGRKNEKEKEEKEGASQEALR